MIKAAIIDHSYHKKTGSTKFLHDIIRNSFDVDYFWDDSWNGGEGIDIASINSGEYRIVFSIQTMIQPEEYERITCGKVVIIPMYDSVMKYWMRSNMHFIPPSKLLAALF